jgi:histidyl-tRNA synthetase
VNNEYYTSQNHYKSIAGDGEVLSLADDLTAGLMNFAGNSIETNGKLCSSREVYSFLPAQNGQVNEYQIGAVIYGEEGVEVETDIINDTFGYLRKICAAQPHIFIGNTNVFQGVLNTVSGGKEKRGRLTKILSGKIDNEIDYAVSQTLAPVRNTEGGSDVIQSLASKLDNKQSIDGLLNLFEICNMFDAYNMSEAVTVKPSFVGFDRYDEGMTFYIADSEGKRLAFGGRCDAVKGKDVIKCVYVRLDTDNCVAAAQSGKAFAEKKVTVAVSATRAAIIKANKMKADFRNEGLITDTVYNASESDVIQMMDRDKERVIIFIDGDGNITHS